MYIVHTNNFLVKYLLYFLKQLNTRILCEVEIQGMIINFGEQNTRNIVMNLLNYIRPTL